MVTTARTDEWRPDVGEVSDEDRKLVTLARSARARAETDQGAAVRDQDGRTYAAPAIHLSSLRLSALQVAVIMAAASGATKLEAAALVGDVMAGADPMAVDADGVLAVRDLSPSTAVFLATTDGEVVGHGYTED